MIPLSTKMSVSEESKSNEEPIVKGTTRLQLLFRIFMVFAGIVVVLGVVGWFLPRQYTVDTYIEIDIPPEELFDMLHRVDGWPKWSPSWDFGKDDRITYFYGDNFTAVTWQVENMSGGRDIGKMWISNTWKDRRIEYFVERNYKIFNSFELQPLDDGLRTRIFWTTEAELPREKWTDGLFYGWAGLIFSTGLESQYDQDLMRLKKLCESDSGNPMMTRESNDENDAPPEF